MVSVRRSMRVALAWLAMCAAVLLACKKDTLEGLTLAREDSGAREAVIGPDGGSISVTTTDGTVFQLSVPAAALATDTKIRAVPAKLAGAKLQGWAVVFEPSGLEFLQDARLTISPRAPVATKERFLFGMSDDQREITAALVDLRTPASVPTAVVQHFSAFGLAQASEQQQRALLNRQIADRERALQSKVGAALQAAERARLAGEPHTDEYTLIAEAAEEYEKEIVKPLVAAAGASCDALRRALRSILGNERMLQLMGELQAKLELDSATFSDTALSRGTSCEQEAIAQCKRSRDPRVLLQFWLGLERARALRSLPSVAPHPVSAAIKEAAKICRPSYAAQGGGNGVTITGVVDDVEKPFKLHATFPGGSATLSYTPSSAKAGTYTVSGGGSGAKLTGKGSYSVTENDDGTLTLNQKETSCVDVTNICRDTQHVITLRPR
jgi:hypothetical protein